jgi:hypothetical protein
MTYPASRGPLSIIATLSNSVAPGGYLIGGFESVAPSVEVTFKAAKPGEVWARYLVVKWIDAANWYRLRLSERSVIAEVSVAGVVTSVAVLSGGAGGWPQTGFYLLNTNAVSARIVNVHPNYASSGRAIVVSIEGLWQGGYPIPVELWNPAPGVVGWLTAARDEIYRIVAW